MSALKETNVATRVSWICGLGALALAVPSVAITYLGLVAFINLYTVFVVTVFAGLFLWTYVIFSVIAVVFGVVGLVRTQHGHRRAAWLVLTMAVIVVILFVTALPTISGFLALFDQ